MQIVKAVVERRSTDCYDHQTAITHEGVHDTFHGLLTMLNDNFFHLQYWRQYCVYVALARVLRIVVRQGWQPSATTRTAFKKSACVPLLPQVLQDVTTTGLVRTTPLAYKRAFVCTRA